MIDWIKTKLGQTLGSKCDCAYHARDATATTPTVSKSETKPEGSPVPEAT